MIEIRAAVPEDVAAIAEVNVRSWQVSFRGLFPDGFLDALNPRERQPYVTHVLTTGPPFHTTVAVDDDEVVGFVMLGPPHDSDLDASVVHELYSLYVEPDRIGTGLGRLLMDEALRHLRAGAWTSAILWAPRDAPRTCRFYESAGWSLDGAEKAEEIPDGNPVVQVRYRIDLQSTRRGPPAGRKPTGGTSRAHQPATRRYGNNPQRAPSLNQAGEAVVTGKTMWVSAAERVEERTKIRRAIPGSVHEAGSATRSAILSCGAV